MFSNPQGNVDLLGIMPGTQVADLGAGIGFYSIPLARAVGSKGKVFALEIQKELLTKLQTNAHDAHVTNIETLVGDVETPGGAKLADGSVDFALAANILFQIQGSVARKNFLIEARRILKPKGRLALIEWADSFGGIGPHPYDVVGEVKAKALGEEQGFVFDRRFNAGEHHYGIIFKKS